MTYLIRTACIALSVLFCVQAGWAQESSEEFDAEDRPKLVVGIVVDQMRYEYLNEYWDKFGDDGFKRMINEGYNFENMHFNYFPTYTGPGHAAVYTGAGPAVNGIVGNEWYNREKEASEYVVDDSEVQTVGSEGDVGKMSPKNLISTTWTDELKDSNRDSKIVGISLKDRGSILPAGHIGDMAFWFDADNGRFVSSTWYMDELPQWVQDFNESGVIDEYSSSTWETLFNMDEYTASNDDNTPYEGTYAWEDEPVFPHDFSQAEDNAYSAMISSPFGNELVKDISLEALDAENLGKDENTDALVISFSSTDYVGHQFGPHSIELQDTYLRLDRDLAEMFNKLDEEVGEGNYTVFLTSDHGVVDVPQELKDRNLPGGYFDSETVVDELSDYLSDTYGDEDWVENYTNQQIYLDRDLVKEEGESLEEMQKKTADFLLDFEGVLSTNTAENFKSKNYKDGLQAMFQRGFYEGRAGDVYIQLKAGWLDSSYSTGTSHGSPFSYDTHAPMLMYGWGVPQGSSSEKVDITQIAPTLSNMLNISFPSWTDAKPLQFK